MFNSKDKIFPLQLITHPTSTSTGAAVFQDPFSLIYSVQQDFTPDFVRHCIISSPLFKVLCIVHDFSVQGRTMIG